VKRIVNWLTSSNLVSTDSSILDLGCGNGIMLVQLVSTQISGLYSMCFNLFEVTMLLVKSLDLGQLQNIAKYIRVTNC